METGWHARCALVKRGLQTRGCGVLQLCFVLVPAKPRPHSRGVGGAEKYSSLVPLLVTLNEERSCRPCRWFSARS